LELRDFFNAFHETDETGIGKAMLDEMQCLGECLVSVDEQSIILCAIG